MGRTYNRVRSKAVRERINGYHIYIQYEYYKSGIEGNIAFFKVTLVLEQIRYTPVLK